MGRVLVCGYYGHYNLGDEAMLAGMLALLAQWQTDPQATVYSNDPADTARRHGVQPFDNRPPRRRLAQWRQQALPYWLMLRHRQFVLGGGDLLRDGPDQSVADVWLRPLEQAVRLQRRTLVWGVSVGQLWRPETKARIYEVLSRVDLVAVRDRTSQAALQALGIQTPIAVMPDLALFAPALTASAADERSASPNRPLQIGVSYRSLANRTARLRHTDTDEPERFTQAMAALLDTLITRYGAEVHLLPFQSFPDAYRQRHRPAVDDYQSSLALLEQCQQSAQIVIHPYFPSLGDLVQQLHGLDCVMGTRLHSLVLAAGLGLPIIAAAYDPKVNAFMTDIGQADWSIPTGEFGPEMVLPKMDNLIGDLSAARHRVAAGLSQYKTTLQPGLAQVRQFWQS